ncbi:hypothetical protein DLD99_13445 [Pseudomonas kribbensis]|uniref:Cytochrome c domain-containing protein n=1 Tax=Pseudomonas kribbensis TaxID=1628086 RepID=A0A345RQ66_9PSED|nr:c-type cytochrome [Pseudomonas kribbensis]AXI61432.1 hypothetical protein DLD99_13445 [Pseudomonas kribbensis]
MLKTIGMLLLCTVLMSAPVLAQAQTEHLMYSNGCVNCHGLHGVRTGGMIPSIAGQPEQYLYQVLSGYRDGSLKGTIMNRVMERMDGDRVKALAEGFGRIDVRTVLVAPVSEPVGERHYLEHCAGCHDAPTAGAPWVRGQNVEYTRAVIDDLRKGRRTMSEEMTRAVAALNDAELQSVLTYLAQWTLERSH